MKKIALIITALIPLLVISGEIKTIETVSTIKEVKLFQNKAMIIRKAQINLKAGNNNIIFTGLPKSLYSWSARGTVAKSFNGKIISMEVEKKALINKGQKRIVAIENKLETLREKDRIFVDQLKSISEQNKFINSITKFTTQTASKELATRIPQIKIWERTLSYTTKKRNSLLRQKRIIEKNRKKLGKKIQKLQFNLSQIAGHRYYRNYHRLNKVIQDNQSSLNIQQFANANSNYALRKRYLKRGGNKVEIEKRVNMNIYARYSQKASVYISYIIPYTRWKMQYDFRADNKKKTVHMTVYASIYQNTGEDWKNVKLSLSTGAPVSSISPPYLYPWYIDVRHRRSYRANKSKYSYYKKRSKNGIGRGKMDDGVSIKEKKKEYKTKVSKKGAFFEIQMPLKQTILSSPKYQKKYLQDFTIDGKNVAEFFYTLSPAVSRNSFLKVKTTNKRTLPWLRGNGQIFLMNQFMGKTTIPYTPQGKSETIVLGNESRIKGTKELVKKYEDTTGVFGSNRRISYSYKITVENQMPETTTILLYDRIPISRNKKIVVELKGLSLNFTTSEKDKKTSPYQRGIRKWRLKMRAHSKRIITYTVHISFDKKLSISGLK